MRQGIATRYFGPTNSRGSRIKATARKARTWSDGTHDAELSAADWWNHATGIEENHTRVAALCAAKLAWSGLWIGAGQPGESGFHYANAGDPDSLLTLARGAGQPCGIEGRDWFWIAKESAR